MISSYLLLNDLRLHYLRWDGGDQQPTIFLHGLASNARIWELVASHLEAEGLAGVAPDARGHGLSDTPEGDYHLETLSRDLAALLNTLDLERPVLVGHSWGALIALDYATRVSLGQHAPAGIILVDGGMTQMDEAGLSWEEMRARLTPPRLKGMPLDQFLAQLKGVNRAWQPDEAAIQIILANFSIDEDDRIAPHLAFEHHMQIVRAMWEFPTYERFNRVRCPVLMIPAQPAQPRSEAEQSFLDFKARGVSRAQDSIAELQVHWMKDSIHDIPLQRPKELADLISTFVKRVRQNR